MFEISPRYKIQAFMFAPTSNSSFQTTSFSFHNEFNKELNYVDMLNQLSQIFKK